MTTPAYTTENLSALRGLVTNGHVLDASTVLGLISQLETTLQAADRVREVHAPHDAVMNPGTRHERLVKVCVGCGTDDGNWQTYPCPTIRALEGTNQ